METLSFDDIDKELNALNSLASQIKNNYSQLSVKVDDGGKFDYPCVIVTNFIKELTIYVKGAEKDGEVQIVYSASCDGEPTIFDLNQLLAYIEEYFYTNTDISSKKRLQPSTKRLIGKASEELEELFNYIDAHIHLSQHKNDEDYLQYKLTDDSLQLLDENWGTYGSCKIIYDDDTFYIYSINNDYLVAETDNIEEAYNELAQFYDWE